MNITKLLSARNTYMRPNKIPTIAFLGDSVTQGCFEIYRVGEGLDTVYDKEHAYSTYVYRILARLYPRCQVTIVNAGISGDQSEGGLARLERDVLSHSPDLTVVCFGLNDSGKGMDYVPTYKKNMTAIVEKLKAAGGEVIVLTPNMMCDKVSHLLTDPNFIEIAKSCAKTQNDGVLDAYAEAARAAARECGVKLCDVYAKWKAMSAAGIDTTALLSNDINHPTRDMNWIFAYSLVETMIME